MTVWEAHAEHYRWDCHAGYTKLWGCSMLIEALAAQLSAQTFCLAQERKVVRVADLKAAKRRAQQAEAEADANAEEPQKPSKTPQRHAFYTLLCSAFRKMQSRSCAPGHSVQQSSPASCCKPVGTAAANPMTAVDSRQYGN
jgi:hypothetical protein